MISGMFLCRNCLHLNSVPDVSRQRERQRCQLCGTVSVCRFVRRDKLPDGGLKRRYQARG